MIQSVPKQLSGDHTSIILLAQQKCFVTVEEISAELSWDSERINRALDVLLQEGMIWIDQTQESTKYWIPTLFFGSMNQQSAELEIANNMT